MEFLRYNGIRYLQATSKPGHVALACPDCGGGQSIDMLQYFGETSRIDRHCGRCAQVMFPVTQDHERQWADAHEVWQTNEFGKQVVQLRRFGVPIGRLKEEPFLALHQVLADLDPVLAYACQWITKGDLEFALNDADIRKRVGQAVTLESAEAARVLARQRIAATKQQAALVTAKTTATAATLFRDDASVLIAMYVMLVQIEAFARSGAREHVAKVRDLATRCDILRKLLSGTMELRADHTRIDYASDEAAAMARSVMAKVEEAAKLMAEAHAK